MRAGFSFGQVWCKHSGRDDQSRKQGSRGDFRKSTAHGSFSRLAFLRVNFSKINR